MTHLLKARVSTLSVIVVLGLVLFGPGQPVTQAATSETETDVRGPVSSATLAFTGGVPFFLGVIPGLPIGNQVKVEWEPVIGGQGEISNETQGTRAECTVVAFTTPAPSNRLRCTVTESNIAGINVGNTLQVTVNFSSANFVAFSAPGLGGSPFAVVFLSANEVCVKNITLSTGVDLATAKIEAK